MTKLIVIGVDASETSLIAARTATEYAIAFGGELKVVSASSKFERDGSPRIDEDGIDHDAQRIADDVVAQLRAEYPTARLTAVATVGKPGEALVNFAETHHADLIVVGNKHVQGLARVLGSIARDVVAHAPCDVLVANTHGN